MARVSIETKIEVSIGWEDVCVLFRKSGSELQPDESVRAELSPTCHISKNVGWVTFTVSRTDEPK